MIRGWKLHFLMNYNHNWTLFFFCRVLVNFGFISIKFVLSHQKKKKNSQHFFFLNGNNILLKDHYSTRWMWMEHHPKQQRKQEQKKLNIKQHILSNLKKKKNHILWIIFITRIDNFKHRHALNVCFSLDFSMSKCWCLYIIFVCFCQNWCP